MSLQRYDRDQAPLEQPDKTHHIKTSVIQREIWHRGGGTWKIRRIEELLLGPVYSDGKVMGSDPYKLMSQVTGQRVEMATQLLLDIINDLDGGDMDFDTPGLPELHRTMQTLAERMSRLFPK